jgi:hypothetical protein
MIRACAAAAVALGLTLGLAAPGAAQDAAAHDHEAMAAATWKWSADANAFFGYNYQKRLFADFSAWESQNWLMLSAGRDAGPGSLAINGMFSFEPLTMDPRGSPQLFQTGESYEGAPLVNFQHPHDLIMGLGAKYRIPRGRITYLIGADLVGSPALGPTAFMHRASARNNPQVPITHHFVDSSHISTGVLTTGVQIGHVTLEASVFRGEEPDENRYNIERPRLDSWAARLGWRRGSWQAQFSGGRLHEPDPFEQADVARLIASIGFDGPVKSRPLAATFIWGQNREDTGFNGTATGYLFEWDLGATPASTLYGRAEVAEKELFGLGAHPQGFRHPAFYYRVTALTAGYIWDIPRSNLGRIGIGGDATLYWMPPGLAAYYGSSRSYHAFIRWRPRTASTHVH